MFIHLKLDIYANIWKYIFNKNIIRKIEALQCGVFSYLVDSSIPIDVNGVSSENISPGDGD